MSKKSTIIEKKYAEVLAFAHIGQAMLERGGTAAKKAFGGATHATFTRILDRQIEFATPKSEAEKHSHTLKKLTVMMEKYVGDSWDDPLEIVEWSGFYFGSAIVHWEVVSALAMSAKDKDSADFCTKQANEMRRLLKTCCAQARKLV